MFWILRRTGAANFFNSLNNNCSTSKGHGSSSQTTQDKYVKRPPRKAYGRLSADSDDASSAKHKIDDPFDDIDNFAMITAANGNGNAGTKNNSIAKQLHGDCIHHHHTNEDDGGGGGGGGVAGMDDSHCGGYCSSGNLSTNSCILGTNINDGDGRHCTAADCQGNYADSNLCEYSINNLCGGGGSATTASNGILKSNSTTSHLYSNKEVNENTINRLQAMAMSDDDDYDESLTCNVCDRAFHCHRQLASHQQKKRHFGCGGCDSLFPSLMLLEHHKEEFEHWSDDEINRQVCCRRNRGDDYFTDTDSFTSDAESEDLERLL